MKTIILANGRYPSHPEPLKLIENAEMIVCCDGSVEKLVSHGFEPDAIVGDLDSVSEALKERYKIILFHDPDQETNDLTKAVKWCISQGIKEIAILGATGLREDHTIANVSLLAEYSLDIKALMLTDTGVFEAYNKSVTIKSYPGQQISLFSIDPLMRITSQGLRYPLRKLSLKNWWRGTLNESSAESFKLEFEGGPLIVFREY